MSYRIKTVAEMLAVPRNTIIAWERRLGILAPSRSEGGYRVYSAADVALLRRLKELMDSGLKVSEAWAMLSQERGAVAPQRTSPEAMDAVREELTEALLAWDRPRADAVAMRLLTVPLERQLDELYQPMLEQIGERWVAGQVSIAQEHFASGWCRERMHVMLHTVLSNQSGGQEVTCATPAGELHDLGLLALAVKLGLRGFRATWLGANLPVAELVRHVEERSPFGVCVSIVQARSEDEVVSWARDLRRRLRPAVRLAVGGPATLGLEEVEVPGLVFCGRSLPPWAEGARVSATRM